MEANTDHTNGHSNGQANGHRAPFKLAPIETPEEEARGLVLREIAPQIRRRVREDARLSAPAKFLFTAIFDDCFWRQAGGHGTGQIFADVRTLAERYCHDEKSIRCWSDELVDAGWLWKNYEWPYTEWRITALMPAPSDNKHKKAVQMALGRRAANVGNHTDTPTAAENGQKSRESGQAPADNGQSSRRTREPIRTPEGTYTGARGKVGAYVAGQVPTSDGTGSHGVRVRFPRATGQVPTESGLGSHEQTEDGPDSLEFHSTTSAVKPLSGEGSLGVRRSGDQEGQGTPPNDPAFQKWFNGLSKMLPSGWERRKAELTAKLRTARTPAARAEFKKRLAAVEELLNGPAVPDQEEKLPPVVAPLVSKIAQRQPTAQELADSAAYLAERRARK